MQKLIQKVDKISFINQPLYNYYIRKRSSLTQIVREDLYELILQNKNNHINLCNKYDCKYLIDVGLKNYMNTSMKYMIDVSESKFNFSKKYNIISEIIKHDEFQREIISYKCPNKFYELLKKACVRKSSMNFIVLVYMLMFKQKINKLVKRID